MQTKILTISCQILHYFLFSTLIISAYVLAVDLTLSGVLPLPPVQNLLSHYVIGNTF